MPTDAPGSAPTIVETWHTKARGLSLNARVALVTVAAVVVAVLVAGAVSLPLALQAARQDSLVSLQRLTDATAAAIERRPARSPELIPQRLAQTLRDEDITALYAPPGATIPGLLSAADVALLATGQAVSGEREVDDETVLLAARGLSGGGSVVLTQPVNATSRLAVAAISRFAFALAVGVAIAVVFGFLLARRLTRPLREAAEAAKRLAAGDREVELSVTGPPEIAELNEALNGLRHALAVSEGRQRDFLLSVSHELRTPLTAIRGYAEAIADGIVPPADIARIGATVQAEADRLDLLVADLLDLARLDAVDFSVTAIPVDFVAIARAAAQVWSDRASAEGLTLAAELPAGPVPGVTDPTRIRQIIDNLCANALRVTPVGGLIVLALRSNGPHFIEIEVRDSGPGLTADDCAVAFEPAELYSRYRGVRRVGTGVGLALVGRLAARLGGAAAAGAAGEGGARFTIAVARVLPATLADPAAAAGAGE